MEGYDPKITLYDTDSFLLGLKINSFIKVQPITIDTSAIEPI